MEYFCHVWAGAPSCHLELLNKLQKWICRTVGPSLALCIILLDDHLNWLNWFHFLILEGGLLVILIDCMIFSVTIPRCYKDCCTARYWNSLPIECFPMTSDLSGFKSKINRHLLTVGSF